jgi:hypothetical protein
MKSKMSKSSFCYVCRKPIKFDNEHISERTGKKIPLDVDTQEPHDCPVRRDQPQQQGQQSEQPQTQQKRYYQCSKGCGSDIYFHESQRTQNGKWIPLDKQTGEPHQCR